MLLKVCGAAKREDLVRVAGTAAEWVGLWHGVPGGRADLPEEVLGDLVGTARDLGLRPVVVTFLDDPSALARTVARTGADCLQLHGFAPPAKVGAVRRALPDVTLVKVLHVARGKVLDLAWMAAYERCGVDLLLFDSVGPGGRVGSTGTPLDAAALGEALQAVRRPFLLAGGLTADRCGHYREPLRHPGMAGIDVDGAVRGADGSFDPALIDLMATAWRKEYGRARGR